MGKKVKKEAAAVEPVELAASPWARLPGDPAKCGGCAKRGAADGVTRQAEGNWCHDPACHAARVEQFTSKLRAQLEQKYGTVAGIEDEEALEACSDGRLAEGRDDAHPDPVIVTTGRGRGRVFWGKTTAGALARAEGAAEQPKGHVLNPGDVYTDPTTGAQYDVVEGTCGNGCHFEQGGTVCPKKEDNPGYTAAPCCSRKKNEIIFKARAAAPVPEPEAETEAREAAAREAGHFVGADKMAPEAGELRRIALGQIADSPYQVRQIDAEAEDIRELAESIRQSGLLQPLLVRPLGGSLYELVAGHRRRRACELAGLEAPPCIVREIDDSAAEDALLAENIQRKDLTPLEEADSVARRLGRGDRPEEVARRLGVSVKWIYRRRAMAQIAPGWRAFAAAHGCGPEFIERAARIPDAAAAKILAAAEEDPEVCAGRADALAELVESFEHDAEGAPWKARHPEWCAGCAKREGAGGDLFGTEGGAGGKCLDDACWKTRLALYTRELKTELKHEHGSVLSASGALAYTYAEERSKSNPVPVVITDGPHQGQTRWAPKPTLSGGAAKAQSRLKPEEINLAAYWEATATLLSGAAWGDSIAEGGAAWQPGVLRIAALAARYGCGAQETLTPRRLLALDGSGTEPHAVERALWRGVRGQIEHWVTAERLTTGGDAAELRLVIAFRYREARALVEILGIDDGLVSAKAEQIAARLAVKRPAARG